MIYIKYHLPKKLCKDLDVLILKDNFLAIGKTVDDICQFCATLEDCPTFHNNIPATFIWIVHQETHVRIGSAEIEGLLEWWSWWWWNSRIEWLMNRLTLFVYNGLKWHHHLMRKLCLCRVSTKKIFSLLFAVTGPFRSIDPKKLPMNFYFSLKWLCAPLNYWITHESTFVEKWHRTTPRNIGNNTKHWGCCNFLKCDQVVQTRPIGCSFFDDSAQYQTWKWYGTEWNLSEMYFTANSPCDYATDAPIREIASITSMCQFAMKSAIVVCKTTRLRREISVNW